MGNVVPRSKIQIVSSVNNRGNSQDIARLSFRFANLVNVLPSVKQTHLDRRTKDTGNASVQEKTRALLVVILLTHFFGFNFISFVTESPMQFFVHSMRRD